jgi:type II secretory pathway predicted ATPase ExeA
MFEPFYGMGHTPFTRDVPPEALYTSPALHEIVSRLEYAAERQWFAVVTGDCGTGKSTTIRRLHARLDRTRYQVLYLADSKLAPRYFYKGLLEQLGCEAKYFRGDAKRQLHREVEILRGVHQLRPVAIVDEAHLLDRDMLEEVRFLLNRNMDSASPLALILVGQTELWDRLERQAYAAIRQRIDVQCQVPYYDRAEVAAYVQAHLTYAGTEQAIFSDQALDAIYRYSSGAARLINKVCTHSLLYGAQNGHRVIDEPIVTRVIQGELA